MQSEALCRRSAIKWSSSSVPAGAHRHRKESIPFHLQKSGCSSPTPATVHRNLPTLAVPKAVDNSMNNTRRPRWCWPAIGCLNSGHTSAKSIISGVGRLAFGAGHPHTAKRLVGVQAVADCAALQAVGSAPPSQLAVAARAPLKVRQSLCRRWPALPSGCVAGVHRP
jgi:hypothetical protein